MITQWLKNPQKFRTLRKEVLCTGAVFYANITRLQWIDGTSQISGNRQNTTPDVLCSNHFQKKKKNASQIAPCWAFSLVSNTCPQGNRLGKISSSNLQGWSSDTIASSWAFAEFISPLSLHLSRALLGAWLFGLFRSVYSSFHPFIGCFILFPQFIRVCFIIRKDEKVLFVLVRLAILWPPWVMVWGWAGSCH